MRISTGFLALPTIVAWLAAPATATDYSANANQYVRDHVNTWIESPEVLGAIKAQNEANAALSQSQIDSLDLAWRAEIDSPNKPTISAILNNPTSDLLRAKIDESNGVIVEAFVMDNRGLNVATAGLTSDYWQGDEAKFSETFGVGAGAFHIGEVEFDESSQTYSIQVSFTINDPATQTPLGAMTIALNAEALE